MASPACTRASHEAAKSDYEAFRAATTHTWTETVDGEVWEYRNCRACRSTLGVLVPPLDEARAPREDDRQWQERRP